MTHNEYVARCATLQRVREQQYYMLLNAAGVRREVHSMAIECAIAEEAVLSRTRSMGLLEDDGYWEHICAQYDARMQDREHPVF